MSISIDESEWRILFTAIGEGRQTITKVSEQIIFLDEGADFLIVDHYSSQAELVDLLDSVGARLAGGEIEQLYRKYDAGAKSYISYVCIYA